MIMSYLFEYKNQVEVKAVFLPLLKTTSSLNTNNNVRNMNQNHASGAYEPFSPTLKD